MGRNAEGIKESFQFVTGHDKTKIFLAFRCQIQQPLPDGRRQMQDVSSGERLRHGGIRGDRAFKLRFVDIGECRILLKRMFQSSPNPVSLQDAPQ